MRLCKCRDEDFSTNLLIYLFKECSMPAWCASLIEGEREEELISQDCRFAGEMLSWSLR